jgi:hypothetical protein
MNFKEWLVKEGGKGSGPKFSVTGLRSGGNSSISSVVKVVMPHMKIKNKF